MKNNSYGALMILALALIVGVPMIQGQSRAKATVPFEFSMEQSVLPAGAYEVSSPDGRILVVRNLDTREGRLMIEPMHVEASEGSGAPKAKMVFHKYDNQYFLAQIWDGQSHIGIAFPESKREKELQIADNNAPQAEVVIIAMK